MAVKVDRALIFRYLLLLITINGNYIICLLTGSYFKSLINPIQPGIKHSR